MKAIMTILVAATLLASCSNGTPATTPTVDSTKVTVDTTKKTVDTTVKVNMDTTKKK